jgi:hypothetical protein
MKLIFALLLVAGAACNRKPAPPEYPRVVHNACTGAYAVRTGVVPYHYGREDAGYWGRAPMGVFNMSTFSPEPDTAENERIGLEFQFKDSLTAISKYLEWKERIRRSQEIAAQNRHTQDSIYECQHTYN